MVKEKKRTSETLYGTIQAHTSYGDIAINWIIYLYKLHPIVNSGIFGLGRLQGRPSMCVFLIRLVDRGLQYVKLGQAIIY